MRAATVLAVAALAASACSSTKLKTVVGCQTAADCGDPAAWSCQASTGTCHCTSNAACPAGQFCNPAGFCQAKVTCYTNADCPTGEICDFTSNVCIAMGRCTSDAQCPIGQLCDLGSGTCQAGCHDYGDCPLPDACLCPGDGGGQVECVCAALDPAGRGACAIGQCNSSYCPVTWECPYGQTCLVPDGGTLPICVNTYDSNQRPYCDACTQTPGTNSYCGSGANFCLLQTANGQFGGTYCGSDCSQGQLCPSGYICDDVVVVRSVGCGMDSDRPTDSVPCLKDADCPNDGLCRIPSGAAAGFCSGRCYKGEGEAQGFCTCVIDSECDQDTCDSASRQCSISRRDCSLQGGGCQSIHCISFQGAGGCFIGQNCVPAAGLTCQQVRP